MSTSTPATRADLFECLDQLGIATRTVEHAAVFTVGESEALHRELTGGHTKNLFLKDAKDRLFLVVAEAHASIGMKVLHRTLHCARLSFGKPELLMEVLGVTPGSVTAFAVINDHTHRVTVAVDASLMAFETINSHPLTNTATTSIARDDLMKFFRATGHDPLVVQLPVAALAQ